MKEKYEDFIDYKIRIFKAKQSYAFAKIDYLKKEKQKNYDKN